MITAQQFDDIIDAISTTADGLRKICSEAGTDPKEFYRHISKYTDDCQRYARAKEAQAQVIFDNMRTVAADGSSDFVTDADGNEKFQSEHVQRSKLIVETDKWVLAKLKPKVYGDKIEQTNTNINIDAGSSHAEIAEKLGADVADEIFAKLLK